MSNSVPPKRHIAPVAKAIAEIGFEQNSHRIDHEMTQYILQKGDFAEIDAYFVKACGISLEQLIDAIWPQLNIELTKYLRKPPLTDGLKLGFLYADLTQEIKPAIRKKIRDKIPTRGKELIILKCVSDFQNCWVSLHENEFANPTYDHLLYKYMPYQMIGFEEVKRTIHLLMPIFQAIDLASTRHRRFYQKAAEPLGELTSQIYRQEQESFKIQCAITDSSAFLCSFETLFRRGFLYSTTIHRTICANDYIINQLYIQVAEHSPGVFCQRPSRSRKKD